MVVRGSRELVIRPQENHKFASTRMEEEAETMPCGVKKLGPRATRLRLGLAASPATGELYDLGKLLPSLSLQPPH